MDVINEIIQNSAIGKESIWHKTIALSLFTTIVTTLGIMMTVLLTNVCNIATTYGY